MKLPQSNFYGLAHAHKVHIVAEHLTKDTHFTMSECKALVVLHERLETAGPLTRLRMREVLHVIFDITDDVMLDLAFKAFDRDNDNYVCVDEFVKGLSIMLRGTTDELSEWCYFIYDINSDGGLAREELAHCLKGCIYPGYGVDVDEIEDGEREIVEIAMRKLDVDRDGQITLTDFKRAVRRDPTLLVSVGPCLPPTRCCAAFLALITEQYRSYTGPVGRHVKKLPRKRSERKSLAFGERKSLAFGERKSLAIGLGTDDDATSVTTLQSVNSFHLQHGYSKREVLPTKPFSEPTHETDFFKSHFRVSN